MATTYILPEQWDAAAIKTKTDEAGVHTSDTDFTDVSGRLAARLTTAGVVEGLEVTPGSGFSIDVSAGVAAVDGVETGQGRYLAEVISGSTEVDMEPSSVVDDRWDALFLVVRDTNYDFSARGYVSFGYVTGDPGVDEVPDPDPSWTAYLPLALIKVGAGAVDHTEVEIVSSFYESPQGIFSPPARSTIDGGGNPGEIVMTAAAQPSPGWLLCQGQEVAIDDYPRLHAVIGDLYGSASSGNFRLPDLVTRFPVGAGTLPLADTGGSFDHSHSNPNVNDNGNHNHSQGNTGTEGSHAHSQGNTGYAGGHSHSNPNVNSNGNHSHSASTELGTTHYTQLSAPGPSDGSHLDHGHGISVNSNGSHSHSQGSTGSVSNHRHSTPNVNSNGNHSHTNPDTDNNGSHAHSQGDTGTARPPYIALNYQIRT